tara:strand:+ start:429 stop:623 length:195 start_codon:yes stop_codon:yes gene_type:complete
LIVLSIFISSKEDSRQKKYFYIQKASTKSTSKELDRTGSNPITKQSDYIRKDKEKQLYHSEPIA